MAEDRIYAAPLERVGDFRFDEKVAAVFPDMIARSVPGYGSVLAMTGELAERYAVEATRVYDLGCSLGAASLSLQPRIPGSCEIHAIDSSHAMIRRLQDSASSQAGTARLIPVHADVRDIKFGNASFAILNFTLQFVPLEGRAGLLHSVYHGLNPGGGLVLSEKVHFEDAEQQKLMTELHHDFKRANGYTDLEISQKRTSLEKTLVTESTQDHVQRLRQIGFRNVSLWFQCFNFVSILAVK